MELRHIDIDKLKLSAINMRHARKAPDVSDILPSIRARGVLMTLIVRPNGDGDTFEIVAGRRRYFAAKAVAAEGGEIAPLPCAVMEPGDDAAALEASLIENVLRLDPDEMTQCETFTRLLKDGRSIADIAATFGITEVMVKRRLALGGLLPKIRNACRREDIDAETVRLLTLATKAQQKEWLKLFEDPKQRAPRGYRLKQWLFGGQDIATAVAIFPLEAYRGHVVSDLFGEAAYFADTEQFWTLQNQAIAARRDALLESSWSGVEVLEPGERFYAWSYIETPKEEGGKVYIAVSHSGEVEINEGYLTPKEAKRAARRSRDDGDTKQPALRPEITKAMANYLDLHRHVAVRDRLLSEPGVALRLVIAHIIIGSSLWGVEAEPQRARKDETADSLSKARGQVRFAEKRQAVLRLLGLPEHSGPVVRATRNPQRVAELLGALLRLSDDDVMTVLAFVMAETLEVGTVLVEALGVHLNVQMADYWEPDDAFFDLLRDKAAINAMLRHVGGKRVADSVVSSTAKVQKRVIRDFLEGQNGCKQVEGWLPNYMAFPFKAYTKGGALGREAAWKGVKGGFETA